MFNFALILILAGMTILAGMAYWVRLRQELGNKPDVELSLRQLDLEHTSSEAVLVAREYGQLVYINEKARQWLGVRSDVPSLEYIARIASPADSFRALFTGEPYATFQIGDRWVEANALPVPTENEIRTVVTLRELSTNGHYDVMTLDVSTSMQIINEIGETVNASLGVEQVLQSILNIIRKHIDISAGEICLWDEKDELLYQRGWLGDAAYVLSLATMGGFYQVGDGITGWIARYREPLLVSDVHAPDAVKPRLEDNPYSSFIAVPLSMGERFLGTLEITHMTPGTFQQSHLALLQAVAKSVAMAIFNAELYAAQVRRIDDIASLQQIARDHTADHDVASVYMALNERIAGLIHTEVCGVLLYDEQREVLVGQTPFFGLPDGLVRAISVSVSKDTPGYDIWTQQEYWISNDLGDDPMIEQLGLAPITYAAGLRNMTMMVMQIGRQRIGMIMVANKASLSGFTTPDIQNLRILVAQAAIVVENIRLFEREQRHDTELVGLQEITHAIGALSNEDEVYVYSDINTRIAGLMSIQMCGVLLYDEPGHRLIAQLPFYGVEDDLLQGYAIDLHSNEVIQEIWEEQDYWYTNRAMADTVVFSAGLAETAEHVGVEKTMIAALSVGGRKIGAIQVSNKVSGEDFNDNDARLLLIFATQAAAIIENARLVREVQRRADEADRLRLVAELAGNLVTMDETLAPVLSEIARLTNSSLAFLSILRADDSVLLTPPRGVFGAELSHPLTFDINAENASGFVSLTQAPLVCPQESEVHPSYQTLVQHLQIEQMMVVPLLIGERSLGEVGVANADAPYDEHDLDLLTSAAAQLAATIDRVRLFETVDANLNRRVQELEAISGISKVLNETLDLNSVLDSIRQQAARATNADDGTVAMLRTTSNWDVSRRRERLALRIGAASVFEALADIELRALEEGVVIVDDYATTDLQPQPAGAASAVAMVFQYAETPVGIIHLYARRPALFDERAVFFLGTLALKASLGFGNAVRQQEQIDRNLILRQRVDQLNQIFELGQMIQTDVDPRMMLEAIAYSIVQSVGFDVVVITMADRDAGVLRRQTQAGLPVDAFERSKADVLPLDQVGSLLKDELRISESYFYPIEEIIRWEIAGLDALSAAYTGNRTMDAGGPDAWQDGDMLLVPISGAGGELLGIMSLDRPQDNKRPAQGKIEILEIFAHQAATTIENNRLYQSSLRSAEEEVRLNALMDSVTRTLDTDRIIELVAENALGLVSFTRMVVVLRNDSENGYVLTYVNVHPENGSVDIAKEGKSSLDYTALGRTIQGGADYVYTQHNDIAAYKDLTEWYAQGEHISFVTPLLAGGETLGALYFGSTNEHDFHVDERRPVLSRIANITAVAIQNARLFNQAVNLRIFNESIVESIQQGIVVLDRSGRVVSANSFMRDEYGWQADGRHRDIFGYSPELAEHLAEALRDVLEHGEPEQVLNLRTRDAYDERLVVRNFYMYPMKAKDSVSGAVLLIEDVTERALLEENIEGRANQLAALTRVSGRITSTLRRNEVIELALDSMREVIEYDTMTLWRRIDPETMQLVGVRGIDIAISPPIRARVADVSRINRVVESSNVMTIDNLEYFLSAYPYMLPGDVGAQSWLGVPLISRGYVIGMIAVTKNNVGYYSPQAEQAAMAFANQVAVALSNADLFTETTARTERLSVLNRVSLALVQSMDSENIFEIALTEIAYTLSAEKAQAVIFNNEVTTGRVVVDSPRGDSTPTQHFVLRHLANYRYILERMQPLVYSYDRTKMPEALEDDVRESIESRGMHDYLLLPMMATGRMIGAFEFKSRNRDMALSADTLEIGLIIANQTAIAIQNANQLEEITTRTRELETLLDAAQSTSLTMDLQQVFKTVVELMLSALDMDDCAIMTWDDVENMLEVQIDVNRNGDPSRISPPGTRLDVTRYPARAQSLRNREAVVINVDDPNANEREREEMQNQGTQARLLVPLVVRDLSIGLIQVELNDSNRRITEQERRLARALGAQVAIAIENARLSTEAAAQMDELFIINDLSQAISATIDVDSMLDIVREQVPVVTGANEMYLALYNSDAEQITFPLAIRNGESYDIPLRQLARDEVSFVIRNRRPLNLDNNYFSAEDLRKSLGLTNSEGDVKSYLGVPLVAGDEVLGVLAVIDRQRNRVFGLNDQRIMTTVGSQLGAALQNARLFQRVQRFADELNVLVDERTQELEEERDRLDMLYQITAELALTLDMDRVLSRALQMIASAVKAHDGVIMLIDPMTDRLYNRASLSYPTESPQGGRQTHPAESLATWLINNDREMLVDDLHDESFWDRTQEGAEQWRSAMAVLLETNEDVQGVLVLLSRDVDAFSDPLLNLVIAAANQVASAINNADLYQLIRDQAERLGTLLRNEQEEAEKSNAILESIADGVILTDNQGRISLFNTAAEDMLNLRRNEAMGYTLRELIAVHGENVAAWAEPVLQWAEHTSEDGGTERMALPSTNRMPVGDRVLSVNIAAVHNGPQYLGAVSVFRDITRDVEVDKLKNEFIRRATHELRTPLTPIKGFASMMLMPNTAMPETVRDQIKVIKSNADRLADLVEDLLTVSKIDAGDNRMTVEPVDMAEVVHIQVKNAQNRHFGKKLDVNVNVEDRLPMAVLDKGKTMQIVGNLVDNAFNYTPLGGKITIDLKRNPEQDKSILLTVADTGVGIPEDFQDKVWDRFARYEQHALNMDIPGTGLGLSIVRDLVRLHGGEVEFMSKEGEGTTFFVTLPLEYKRVVSSASTNLIFNESEPSNESK